jgi:hypothetical protein
LKRRVLKRRVKLFAVCCIDRQTRIIPVWSHHYDMRAALCKRHEKENIVNKTIFEENWSLIRSLLTAKWSLMVEYDLNKVDKAEVKFDKFVTMLQVKYGYTRQEARDKIGTLWTEYEANHKISV